MRAVRGDSAHVMHSRMYFGHSGMHVTRSARVAWLVHAPQKSGFMAAIGKADQGHGVGLWATGTPQDTHGDA